MCYILQIVDKLEIPILMLTYTQYVERFKQTKFKYNQTLFYVSKFNFLYIYRLYIHLRTPCKIMIL